MLKAGQSQTLKMTINKRDLASFDEAESQWKVDPGVYTFKVGANVEDIKGQAKLNIKEYTEKVSDVLKPQYKLNLLHQ